MKRLITAFILTLLLPVLAIAANVLVYPKFQAFDSNGNALQGGKVYTYHPGSTTSKATYSNNNLTTANTNPVILDSRGEANIYLSGAYKLILRDSAGTLIWTMDNIVYNGTFNIDDSGMFESSVTANPGTVVFSTPQVLSGTSLSIPQNIYLVPKSGASLYSSNAAGTTVNFHGPFNAGLFACFNSAQNATGVTVIFWPGSVDKIFPQWFGAKGDSSDQAVAIQAAYNASPENQTGMVVEFIPASGRYDFSSPLTVPNMVSTRGGGKYNTILRYTGNGTAMSPKTVNSKLLFDNFTLQLSGTSPVGIDASKIMETTFRSIKIANSLTPGINGTGIKSLVENILWTPYFNLIDDCTFDGLETGVTMHSTVAQYPNRWKISNPNFLSVKNGIHANAVKGLDIIAPYFNEHTGYGITIGPNADRITVIAPRQETSFGGTMFNIDNAANRVDIHAPKTHAGAFGLTSAGLNASIFGDWDIGVRFSGASSTGYTKMYGDGNSIKITDNTGVTGFSIGMSGVSVFDLSGVTRLTQP